MSEHTDAFGFVFDRDRPYLQPRLQQVASGISEVSCAGDENASFCSADLKALCLKTVPVGEVEKALEIEESEEKAGDPRSDPELMARIEYLTAKAAAAKTEAERLKYCDALEAAMLRQVDMPPSKGKHYHGGNPKSNPQHHSTMMRQFFRQGRRGKAYF